MKYKKSIFNTIVEELDDGRKLIYNTYSSVFGIMDKKTQELYESIDSYNLSTVEDKDTMNNIETMSKAGYIVDLEKDEMATLKVERQIVRYNSRALLLTIAPTMDCNMCCPYCYEDNKDVVMNKEVQDKLVDFVKMQLDANKNLTALRIAWFGGEPLMQKEIIYDLSQRFINVCKERNIQYGASMITNGSLLDVKTAKRLKEECMLTYAQVTIDGMKETHNKRRVLINGEDSFEIIIRNIEACKDILPVTIRINVDRDNYSEIDSLSKYFWEEKGWKDSPSFYLALVEDNFDVHDSASASFLQNEEFSKINMKCIEASYSVNKELVAHMFFPTRKAIFCRGEGVSSYVVDPEGFFFNCLRQIGKREFSTGHVNKPFQINLEYGKWLLSDLSEKCEKCVYLPICMSSCGLHRVPTGGEAKCMHPTYIYKPLLKLAYQDYLVQKSMPETAAGN